MIRATTLTAGLLAALALGACGKDTGEPIPAGKATALIRGLDTAKRQAEQGSCGTLLRTTIPVLDRRARDLPSSVGSDTRTTIQDGIAHLRELATQQCNQQKQQQQQPTTTTSDTTTSGTSTETTTTDTTTTDTSATTTDTTTQTTTTDTTVPPPTTTPPANGGTPPGAQGAQP
jgi:hypothetical protein